MCGILGFNWTDRALAQKIGNTLAHRGPDQEGYYVDKLLTLGQRRLSILDLSENGRQPMWDEKGEIGIIFNGEIFNFQEIKDDLVRKGYRFRSTSDTEVIIYGYREYGTKILERLNGQFAFCIYDKRERKLFLARDRIGINPLYYYLKEDRFIFGSEMKVIMEAGVEKEIDEFSLNHYFMYGHTPRKRTILKDIYKLEPGHYFIFDLEKKKIKDYRRYWSFTFKDDIKDEETAKRLILDQLEKSVKSRMISDVPVGAFLSGGVDSSAVVAMMSRYTKNLNTFSIKFDYDDFDESEYAEMVSKRFKTRHHVIEFTAEDVRELIPKLAYHYDEPFGDSSMIATYLVSKVARQHVTVSLSGDGGDELFGGYQTYKNYRMLNYAKLVPRWLSRLAYNVLNIFPLEALTLPKAFFEIASLKRELQYAKIMSYLSEKEFRAITGKDPEPYYTDYAESYRRDAFLNEAIGSDIQNYLPDDILTKVGQGIAGQQPRIKAPYTRP